MRQKFFISREGAKSKLNIKEYAIIQKAPKNAASSMPSKEIFSFIAEEAYDGAKIVSSIDRGLDDLVETLRTHNLFPIGPHAIKIAESVMVLYDSEEDRTIELFFDDIDLFEKKPILETA